MEIRKPKTITDALWYQEGVKSVACIDVPRFANAMLLAVCRNTSITTDEMLKVLKEALQIMRDEEDGKISIKKELTLEIAKRLKEECKDDRKEDG